MASCHAGHDGDNACNPYIGLARALLQQGDLFKALAMINTARSLAPSSDSVRALWQQLQGR